MATPAPFQPNEIESLQVKLRDGRIAKGHVDASGLVVIDEIIEVKPSSGSGGSGEEDQEPLTELNKITAEKIEAMRKLIESANPATPPSTGKSSGVPPKATKPSGPPMTEASKQEKERIEKQVEESVKRYAQGKSDTNLEDLKDSAFKAQLTSVMTDNKYDRRLRGRTRGKIDMSRLFKVKTKSSSVFTQKQARKGKNYNVVILLDESGSMRGDRKIENAAKACLTIAQGFDGLVNLSILGFNHFLHVHKDFNTDLPDMQDTYKKMVATATSVSHSTGSHDNHDYDAINTAYNRLEAIAEGKNVLIIISDGYPETCSDNSNFDPNPAPKSVKDSEEGIQHLVKAHSDRIPTIKINILGRDSDRAPFKLPGSIDLKNPDQLKQTLVEVLRKEIKRG